MGSCLEWEVPRELLLHRSELIPPPVLGFERFEENKYTSIKRRRKIVQCKEEDMEKNGYPHIDRLTEMQLTDPASPRTGLGKNSDCLFELVQRIKGYIFGKKTRLLIKQIIFL